MFKPISVFVKKNIVYISDAYNHRVVAWCDEDANIKAVSKDGGAAATGPGRRLAAAAAVALWAAGHWAGG